MAELLTSRVESVIDKEYATGIAPVCCYCGRPIPKADVVWGSSIGAWHRACTPTIKLADGTMVRIVA